VALNLKIAENAKGAEKETPPGFSGWDFNFTATNKNMESAQDTTRL